MWSCWVLEIYCHNSATTFNTSYSKTLSRSKTTNTTCRMSQGTFKYMNRIKLSIRNISQIPNMYPFLTMSCNQQRKLSTHLLNRFCDPRLSNLVQLISINFPKFDHAIPSSWHQDILALNLKSVYIFYRCLMLANSNRLSTHRIPSFNGIIRMSNENRWWILIILKLVTEPKSRSLLWLLWSKTNP
jgi:hypothetical protein